MAKKTANNAVKKIDEQIKDLESKTKKSTDNTVKTSSVKKSTTKKTTATKSTTKKSTAREKVVVTPAKKTTTTTKKKTTTTKQVRDKVVTPKKRSTTKTIESEKIKNDLKSTKTKKDEVKVVAPRYRKKDLVAEVNKILGIDEEPEKVETPKFIEEEKPVEEVEVSVPKFIEEEKTAEINTKEVVKEFLEKEDKKELENTSNISLDDVDVIKFDKPSKSKKSSLKKKTRDEDLKLDKPINLDEIDKVEEYKIVEDISKDVSKKKQEFTRKRKGKGYVVEIKKKPTYTELESDLRSLYDEVEDVVDDFDKTASIPVQPVPKKKKFSLFGPKKEKKKVVKPTIKPIPKAVEPVKKTRVVKDTVVIADTVPGEKPSILDRISQKVLNFFLTVLFIIFFIMVIAFIGFVIYVSTF